MYGGVHRSGEYKNRSSQSIDDIRGAERERKRERERIENVNAMDRIFVHSRTEKDISHCRCPNAINRTAPVRRDHANNDETKKRKRLDDCCRSIRTSEISPLSAWHIRHRLGLGVSIRVRPLYRNRRKVPLRCIRICCAKNSIFSRQHRTTRLACIYECRVYLLIFFV